MNTYIPEGVCAKKIVFQIDGTLLKKVSFISGCPGNLEGLCKLAQGMEIQDVINRLKGIKCGPRSTSCPDQLSKALEKYLKNDNE